MGSELQKNDAVDVLRRHIHRELGDEIIDGVKLDDAVNWVELSIGYTPIVMERWRHDDDVYHADVPTPVRVQTDGVRYAAVYRTMLLNGRSGVMDFKNLSDDEHRRARARYLLIRGLVYRRLDHIWPWSSRMSLAAAYFPEGVWRPAEESPLYAAMGLNDPRSPSTGKVEIPMVPPAEK